MLYLLFLVSSLYQGIGSYTCLSMYTWTDIYIARPRARYGTQIGSKMDLFRGLRTPSRATFNSKMEISTYPRQVVPITYYTRARIILGVSLYTLYTVVLGRCVRRGSSRPGYLLNVVPRGWVCLRRGSWRPGTC